MVHRSLKAWATVESLRKSWSSAITATILPSRKTPYSPNIFFSETLPAGLNAASICLAVSGEVAKTLIYPSAAVSAICLDQESHFQTGRKPNFRLMSYIGFVSSLSV